MIYTQNLTCFAIPDIIDRNWGEHPTKTPPVKHAGSAGNCECISTTVKTHVPKSHEKTSSVFINLVWMCHEMWKLPVYNMVHPRPPFGSFIGASGAWLYESWWKYIWCSENGCWNSVEEVNSTTKPSSFGYMSDLHHRVTHANTQILKMSGILARLVSKSMFYKTIISDSDFVASYCRSQSPTSHGTTRKEMGH